MEDIFEQLKKETELTSGAGVSIYSTSEGWTGYFPNKQKFVAETLTKLAEDIIQYILENRVENEDQRKVKNKKPYKLK